VNFSCIQQVINKCTSKQTDFQNFPGPAPHLPCAGMGNPLQDFCPHGCLNCDPDVHHLLYDFLLPLYFNLKRLWFMDIASSQDIQWILARKVLVRESNMFKHRVREAIEIQL